MKDFTGRVKMRPVFLAAGVALCCAVVWTGCGRQPEKSVVLAMIGRQGITVADFEERISNLPVRYRSVINNQKAEYLQELINDTLLYQEAVRRGLDKDKEVRQVVEEARKKILIARLLKDEVDDVISITEEDVIKFYNDNHAQYMTPEVMRVSHILATSPESAERISEELKAGAVFEDLARMKSMDPTAQKGGDIGYFPKGQLIPEFESACAQLEIGETSGVTKTKLGYHIIKLTDRKEPQQRPVGQVAEEIKSQLRIVERQRIFNKLLAGLREDADIRINEEALVAKKSDT